MLRADRGLVSFLVGITPTGAGLGPIMFQDAGASCRLPPF